MAYSIYYHSVPIKQEARQEKRRRAMLAGAMALLAASLLIPAVQKFLQQVVFPGSDASTLASLEALAQRIAQGEPMGQAFEVFCQELLPLG